MTSTRASATRVASSAAAQAAAVDSRAAFRLSAASSDASRSARSFVERSASRLATSATTHASRARERDARASRSDERQLGFEVVVPELEQQRAGFDALAVLDGQVRDLPAERRRQAGAATRVDGAGARVRDRGGDGAAFGGDERHGDGLRAREEPHGGERSDDERRNDGDALHGHFEWRIGGRQSNGCARAATTRCGICPVSRWTKFDSA